MKDTTPAWDVEYIKCEVKLNGNVIEVYEEKDGEMVMSSRTPIPRIGIDHIRGLEKKRLIKKFEEMIDKQKLPYPNKYGKTVTVPRVNMLFDLLKSRLEKLK